MHLRCLFSIVIGYSILALSNIAIAAETSALVSIIGESFHVEFAGQSNWLYQLDRQNGGSSKVELLLPNLDSDSVKKLKDWKGPYVNSVEVQPNNLDGKTRIQFSLEDEGIEFFDYITDQPSRLVVDFFRTKPKPTPKPSQRTSLQADSNKNSKQGTNQKANLDATKAVDPQKISRKPSSDFIAVPVEEKKQEIQSGIFDGGEPDFKRFKIQDYEVREEAIIESRRNVYIPFPMRRIDGSYFNDLTSEKPVYEIIPKETEENKQARLLLTLYNKKRYAVFLKTLNWFREKFEKSIYDEMISYMTADVYFAMWLEEKRATDFELAMTHYSQAIAKFPDSKLTERTLLLMGYSYLEKGEALNTLRLFQRHLRERPESPNRDVASLALANAYLKLNRYDDANDVYLNMEQNAKGKSARIEACYLKGDVWFQKKDFGKSIVEYKNAIQKYPEVTSKYPNAFYNSAEAFFWMGEYKKSLEAYTDYLIRFPSDTHAGYAMTRVGELLEILGADKSRVVGVYLETYFRYGDTPGANVAKVRLLSQKMKGMKEKEMLDQIKETKDLVDKSTLPKIQEFATVMIAEGYTRRSEYDKSLDLLSKYYADNPTTANLPLLASRILDNIARKMRDYMSEEKFLEILKVHKAYGESWLKNADRLDIGYFIAEAYEQAGVPLEAEKWLKSTLHKLKNAAQSNQLMERKVFEFLPTEDEVQLHLARVLFESHKYQQSLEALRAIKNPENLTEKDQILRVEVAAKLFDKKGVVESSRRYMEELISVWQGKPELIASVYLQLAELNIQSGKPQEGIKDLIALSQLAAESKKVPPAIHSRALEMLGSQYVLAGKTDEAIGTYTQLLDTYEKTRPLESIRYRLGELHFKKGNLQQAAEVWKPLAEGKTKLWSSLAQEQLSGSNWEKDYKKYIQRIPAMVDRK